MIDLFFLAPRGSTFPKSMFPRGRIGEDSKSNDPGDAKGITALRPQSAIPQRRGRTHPPATTSLQLSVADCKHAGQPDPAAIFIIFVRLHRSFDLESFRFFESISG